MKMNLDVLHVFRNTPLGEETLRQAADFVKKVNSNLHVYIPEFDRFLMYFKDDILEIKLDKSYLYFTETAEHDMRKVLDDVGIEAKVVEHQTSTAANLPDVPTDFDLFSLPRIMTERRGPTIIGSTVRKLIKASHAPALVSPGRFHDWREILVLFGGSEYSIRALRWAVTISKRCDFPVKILTLLEADRQRDDYEKIFSDNRIALSEINDWIIIDAKSKESILRYLPRASMIIMGAYGSSRFRASIFGSTTELVLNNVANLLFLVGEKCNAPTDA
jgi:nucleotide-binding universal stress UspA family protein